MSASNGMPADQFRVPWRNSRWSNPSGNCVEVAGLPGGSVAARNSRHPSGPAKGYTRAETAAFVAGRRTAGSTTWPKGRRSAR
jgi:hypothetical protein